MFRCWSYLALLVASLVSGCADTLTRPVQGAGPAKVAVEFSPSSWADYVDRMAGREPAQLKLEAQRLAGRSPITPPDRLRLAWLLDQEGASEADLNRSLELLMGLEGEFSAPALVDYVRLKRRAVGQGLQLRKERQQVEELQAKIERLKSLEQNLLEGAKVAPPAKK